MTFKWYRIEPDGTASVHDDTALVRAQIDKGDGQWFGSPEGAILHGGVNAMAFVRKTQMTYDASAWLSTGAMIECGEVTTTTITAEPGSGK
ncbi:MAG TPA: hypothetical protein VEF36_01335 [Roseiarcus sp.]|nr:hypothetical protein [Roseiarcus sp.]